MWKAKIAMVLACLFAALGSAGANAQAQNDVVIKELKARLEKTEAVLSAAMKAEAEARQQAEQQRKFAEVAREQAEKERAVALEARKEAERQREIAESLRLLAEKRLAEALQQAEKAKASALEAADQEALARHQAEAARKAAMKESSIAREKSPDAKRPKRGRRPARQRMAELAEQVESLNKQMKQMQAELDTLCQQLQKGSPMKAPGGEATLDKFRLSPEQLQELFEDYNRQAHEGQEDAKPQTPEKKADPLSLSERRQQKERELEMEELRRKLDEVIREAQAARKSELESRKKAHP